MGYDFDYKIGDDSIEKLYDVSRHNHYLNELVYGDERQFTFNELYEVISKCLLEMKLSNNERQNIAEAIGVLTNVLGEMDHNDIVVISYC